MARKRISQRDAARYRKRVEVLEADDRARRLAWARDWTGGVHIASVVTDAAVAVSARTARRLGHAVVVTIEANGNELRLHALPVGR